MPQSPDSLVLLQGVVICPDSIPVENAYLISYTTLRAYATNAKGEFRIWVLPGDSLKVHHVAFKSVIVKPNSRVFTHTIALEYEENIIETISIKYRDLEIENMNKNMEVMKVILGKEFHFNYQSRVPVNSYAPSKGPSGIMEVNLFELIHRASRKLKE